MFVAFINLIPESSEYSLHDGCSRFSDRAMVAAQGWIGMTQPPPYGEPYRTCDDTPIAPPRPPTICTVHKSPSLTIAENWLATIVSTVAPTVSRTVCSSSPIGDRQAASH